MAQSIRVITHITALPGKEEKIRQLLTELVEATRMEPGCRRYELLQSSVTPTEFALVEEWDSDESFSQHLGTPQVEEVLLEASELFATPPNPRRYQLVM